MQLVQPFGLCAGLDWVVSWVGLGWVNPKMTSGLRIGQGQTPPYHPPRTVDIQAVMYRDFFERCLRSTPLCVFPTYIVHIVLSRVYLAVGSVALAFLDLDRHGPSLSLSSATVFFVCVYMEC